VSCYTRILVACDGSAHAKAALAHAVELARDQNARLTLLTTDAPPPRIDSADAVRKPTDREPLHARILRHATATLPPDISVTARLGHGDPATAILTIAADGAHDLIVMGSHGHGRIHRALLGSVSERVLREARSRCF